MAKDAGSLSWLWLSGAVIVIDQVTKVLAEEALTMHKSVPVLSIFNLTLAYNQGAAFSFLSAAGGWQRWLFAALAVLVSAGMTFWLYHLPRRERWTALALALVIGGALGNLIDRLLYGHVIDFLDFHLGGYHWPAFNIADSAISVGAVLILVVGLFGGRRGPGAE
jgi:signal peptidase II